MEARSGVVSRGQVQLVVVLARKFESGSEVDSEVVFRRFVVRVVTYGFKGSEAIF